jgi:hypothetical protein
MDQWFLVLYWSRPIGVGFFLAGLGVLLWGGEQGPGHEEPRQEEVARYRNFTSTRCR